MIRVSVPIDLCAVARDASTAFALVTPLRVEDLLVAAIAEAQGPRAPHDKRERVLRSVRDGLEGGDYVVEIDGRRYDRLDDVVVCAGIADIRFFLRHGERRDERRRGALDAA